MNMVTETRATRSARTRNYGGGRRSRCCCSRRRCYHHPSSSPLPCNLVKCHAENPSPAAVIPTTTPSCSSPVDHNDVHVDEGSHIVAYINVDSCVSSSYCTSLISERNSNPHPLLSRPTSSKSFEVSDVTGGGSSRPIIIGEDSCERVNFLSADFTSSLTWSSLSPAVSYETLKPTKLSGCISSHSSNSGLILTSSSISDSCYNNLQDKICAHLQNTGCTEEGKSNLIHSDSASYTEYGVKRRVFGLDSSGNTRKEKISSSKGLFLIMAMAALLGFGGTDEQAYSVVNISADRQIALTYSAEIECLERKISNPYPPSNATYCDSIWDGILCWPYTESGVAASQPCPSYVNGFRPWENATRRCMEDGNWYFDQHHNRTWTDLSACLGEQTEEAPNNGGEFIKSHMDRIRLMYNVGYGVSLASLVLSVIIMLGFRKLHCPRNTIHLNLFMSFILRASFSFMKENLLVAGLGFPSDVERDDQGEGFIFKNGSLHWECKFFFTCFYYILGANYMWIFAEALYLHMLISVAVFSEKSSIKWYILFGWASPSVFVIPWVIVRALLEDVYCWNTHPTGGYFWIMRGPIVLSIFINFFFFLNIVRVLFTKLNAVNSPEAKKFRYRKLAKSTLVLIPLFGVHYIVFAGLPKDVNQTAELIQLYFEMCFNSIQGFFVALLFCFLNGEVQSEIKKKWHRLNMTYMSDLPIPRGSSRTNNTTTFATYLSRPRESNASLTQLQESRYLHHQGSGGGIADVGMAGGRGRLLRKKDVTDASYSEAATMLIPLRSGRDTSQENGGSGNASSENSELRQDNVRNGGW